MVLVCTGDALSLAVDGAGGGTVLGVIVLGVIVMLSLFICLTIDRLRTTPQPLVEL